MFRYPKRSAGFLKVLLSINVQRILEVGTAVGFSAILMAEYDPVECEIITIRRGMRSGFRLQGRILSVQKKKSRLPC